MMRHLQTNHHGKPHNIEGGVMREIKFRALDNSGVWKYGYYRRVKNSPVNGKYINQHTITDNHFESLIKPETLGEYTGLKDKNGKDIYEGDVLRGGIYKEYDVKWDENGWNIHPDSLIAFEIIGNIHEEK